MNILDLCNLSADLTKKLNKIAENSRLLYTELIDKLSEKYKTNANWWVTPLVSRETSLSSGFRDFCIIRLALDEISTGAYSKALVPKKSLYDTLKLNIGNNVIDIEIKEKKDSRIKRRLNMAYSIYNIFRLYKRINIVKKNSDFPDLKKFGKKSVLIDTYMIPSQFQNGNYTDRYFDGLMDNTAENVIFLAQLDFNSLNEGAELAQNVNKLDNAIIFEKYVTKKDFREILSYSYDCRKFHFKRCLIGGIDIRPIINSLLRQDASNITSMYGILKGNVVCRLINNYKLDVKRIIGWYEGQPSSNGMFYKVRRNNSNIPTVAYVYAPCPENNLGLYPSKIQRKNKGVAEIYASPGRAWIKSIKQFDKKTKCILAPSFRYDDIFHKKKAANNSGESILIVLSGVLNIASQQLKACMSAFSAFPHMKVLIKNHPFYEKATMADYRISEAKCANLKYEFVHGKMDEILDGVKIAVISETSSGLELIIKGISIISFIPSGCLCYSCMPIKYENLVHKAYTCNDIRQLVRKLKIENIEASKLEELKSESFIRVNRENVDKLLKEEYINE